jgi:hypothetical protein
MFHIAIENEPFIVDLPIKNGDFPSLFVSLPEANTSTACFHLPEQSAFTSAAQLKIGEGTG